MVETIRLGNGVTLLLEPIDNVLSAAVGLWAGVGSRHELPEQSGISHCLEHMVFKGTPTRSAADIAQLTDAVGGQFNAFTTKECTAFYARVLTSHLPLAIDVLTDMVFHANCHEDDLQNERRVILEEIGMYEDTPEDLVAEQLFARVYPEQSVGLPILGTPESLGNMTGAALRAFRDRYYRAPQLLATLAGRYTDADVARLTQQLEQLPTGQAVSHAPAVYTPAFVGAEKAQEQNHLCLALPGLSWNDERRHALQLLCGMLGGGASSRLYQLLREQKGLCYAVHSYTVSHADTGLLCLYTALGRETEFEALTLLCQVLCQMAEHGPTADELDRCREQLKANVIMSMESTGARASHAARSMLAHGHVPTPELIAAQYDAVTLSDVRALAQHVVQQPSFSAVGQIGAMERYETIIRQFLT